MNKHKLRLFFILFLTAAVFTGLAAGDNNYEKGKALFDKKEYKAAYPFFVKAAESGNADAMMHLGKMFYNGWGVPHSHEKGHEWHSKAAKLGNKESIEKLKKMNHH